MGRIYQPMGVLMLTTSGKAFVITLGLILVGMLIYIVLHGSMSNDCEALYNDYMSTADMSQRDVLFSKGINNGCFHTN